MEQAQQMLLHLLSGALTGKASMPVPATDWEAVFTEAQHQAVPLMALDAASAYTAEIPAEVYDHWMRSSVDFFEANWRVTAGQAQLTALLSAHQLPYVILKGAAAAAFYPRPELRLLGDVDFLIRPEQQTAVQALLLENGYTLVKADHHCHVAFEKENVKFEMHFALPGLPGGECGRRVQAVMSDLPEAAQTATVEGESFPVPAPFHQAVIFLLHMQQHTLGEGLGLRHLCDWLCFVQQTAHLPFWEQQLLPFIHDIGLYTYAAVMTKLGALYFGLPCPAWVQAEDAVCHAIMEDMLAGGNFGTKDKIRWQSARLISEHGKEGTKHGMVYHACRTMHRYVLKSYPFVRKVPIVYPFLFVYRLCRSVIFSAIGKRESLERLTASAAKRKAVYQLLKIFETE